MLTSLKSLVWGIRITCYEWDLHWSVFFLHVTCFNVGNISIICVSGAFFELDSPQMDANSKNAEKKGKLIFDEVPHYR